MKTGWTHAALTGKERAMLKYTEKLTARPGDMQQSDVEALRAAGYDDVAILQINLIASWFNYINRVADGLGIGHR
ncbi:MAG: peroxidase [Armatimonadetes bacterium]|nr:peroxidase [Armatimonadota bacterium]